jgi:hypothetical protein
MMSYAKMKMMMTTTTTMMIAVERLPAHDGGVDGFSDGTNKLASSLSVSEQMSQKARLLFHEWTYRPVKSAVRL